jgi:hypothetical protein
MREMGGRGLLVFYEKLHYTLKTLNSVEVEAVSTQDCRTFQYTHE